jgi:Ca-activated chloride channel family protein
MRVDIDDESLTKIANITGGRYFRATDKTSLEKIYQEIGELEKTKIEVKEFTRYEELFIKFLALAFGVLMLEIILANTRFRRIP